MWYVASRTPSLILVFPHQGKECSVSTGTPPKRFCPMMCICEVHGGWAEVSVRFRLPAIHKLDREQP
jgi:hypothetical protein